MEQNRAIIVWHMLLNVKLLFEAYILKVLHTHTHPYVSLYFWDSLIVYKTHLYKDGDISKLSLDYKQTAPRVYSSLSKQTGYLITTACLICLNLGRLEH